MTDNKHPLHPKLRTPIAPIDDENVRKPGQKSSPQNALRAELYRDVWGRINNAMENECFFEVITLCDMVTTDRMEAFSQYLMYTDENHFQTDSIGESFKNFGWAIKYKGSEFGISKTGEVKELYNLIQEFVELRNKIVHGHLIVRNSTENISLDERVALLNDAAQKGIVVARKISRWTEKNTNI
jgi:hypothetical protein